MENYDIMRIKGKHGMINLHIPKKEATQEDYDDLHRTVAEIIMNTSKNNKPANKK